MLYEPREDSYLLQKYLEKYCKKGMDVLDMGTGSGIQGMAAAHCGAHVVAADIDEEVLQQAKDGLSHTDISFYHSDLFEHIPNQKFDIIAFNPPYLPEEGWEDKALFSPKRGADTTVRFLDQAADYLKQDGIILLISSSLADQRLIEEAIKTSLLTSRELERFHVFFEDVFILLLKKSPRLKKLHALGVSGAHIYDRGKRGIIVRGIYEGKDAAVKIKRKDSTAPGNIENEARFLKILNEHGIGPKFYAFEQNMLIRAFIEGEFIQHFVERASRKDIIVVLKDVFEQMFVMDNLGINKFEMHRPIKHIIVRKKKPVLIDFERCRHTQNPKNVTQFVDYMRSLIPLLKKKGIILEQEALQELAAEYKKKKDKKSFDAIVESF